MYSAINTIEPGRNESNAVRASVLVRKENRPESHDANGGRLQSERDDGTGPVTKRKYVHNTNTYTSNIKHKFVYERCARDRKSEYLRGA